MSEANGGPAKAGALAETLSPGTRAIVTLAVMAATLMEVLDISVVNVALPHMEGSLGATLDEIGWVATGYIISNVIVLPLTGWLSDWFGRKRYLTGSIVLFTLSSLGCGLSRSLLMLVGFRVLQGAGGAAFLSTAQATLIEIYPEKQQGFAQAMFGIGVIMAPTLGPTLGGFLTDRYSWPFIFFVNLPIGVVAALLSGLYVPDSPASAGRRRMDLIGIGLLAVGLGALQTLLEKGQEKDWFSSPFIREMTVLAAVGLVLFVYWELRPHNRHPAVDLRLLRQRNLTTGTIYAFGLGFVLYGTVFALPQYWQILERFTAEQTGIILIPGGLASAAMMPLVGQLSNRIDRRFLVGAGMLLTIYSMWAFSGRFTLNTPEGAFFWPLVWRGAGIGLQFVPLSLLALATLPTRDLAQGSGLYNLFRQLGGSFGIAILTTILDRSRQTHHARLGAHLVATSQSTRTALVGLTHHFAQAHAVHPRETALRALAGMLEQQAMLLSYVDLFRIIAVLGIAALPLLFLFKRGRGGNLPAPH